MPLAAAGKSKCPKMLLAQGQLKDAKGTLCHCSVGFRNVLGGRRGEGGEEKKKRCFSAENPNARTKLIRGQETPLMQRSGEMKAELEEEGEPCRPLSPQPTACSPLPIVALGSSALC